MHRVDHLPVFLPDTETADCPFARVVIHRHIPVFQKNSQIRLLVQRVGERFPGFPTFGHPAGILFHVRKESIHQWFHHQLTFFNPLIRRKPRQLPFLTVDGTDLVHEQIQNRLFPQFFRNDLQCFLKLSPAVNPAACDLQIFLFFFQCMVDLIAVCHTDACKFRLI